MIVYQKPQKMNTRSRNASEKCSIFPQKTHSDFSKKMHLFSGHVADIVHTLLYNTLTICMLGTKKCEFSTCCLQKVQGKMFNFSSTDISLTIVS